MKRSIEVYNKIPEASSFKVAPFDNRKKHTQPHRHNNYFEIIYLSSCDGNHWIDSVKYEAKPPVVYFLQKDVIHHWELEGEVHGYVIIIKNQFVEAIKDGVLRSLFITLHAFKCLYLPPMQVCLIYSGLNITEISFKLEFRDPSYFIKYFKRQTGHTPEEYRSLHTKPDSP